MPVLFGYVDGLRGMEPQRWPVEQVNGAGRMKTLKQAVELPDAYADLPLQQLVQLYPYKGESK